MKADKPGNDRLAYRVGRINLSGLTMTKVILWLVAITIVSFVIGFGILALSGDLSTSPDNKVSPFRHTASYSPNTTAIPLDGATTGTIRITLGAGEVTISGNAPAPALLEATVYTRTPDYLPEIVCSVNGTEKTVTMIEKDTGDDKWFADHSPGGWKIRLSEAVPLDLNVELGAGDSSLDLGSLNLASLSASTGVGDTEIDISRYRGGPFHAEIHNGVGDLTLRIDKNSNTRIRMHQGVGDITTNGIEQNKEYYTTPGFDPALPVNEITVTQGIGSVQLEAE
jgi:hypothetical protein